MSGGTRPSGSDGRPPPGAFRLSIVLALVMGVQSALGLAIAGAYRDTGYVLETWLGNDLVTLAVGLPVLLWALARARRSSPAEGGPAVRARLIWIGALGYGAYNYAFYLFGAAINAFFPVYVAGVVSSAGALILLLASTEPGRVAASFGPSTPVRPVGGYLLTVAIGLSVVWLVMWARHVFGGQPVPVAPEAFRLVAALDLTVMVPALGVGGTLLWLRRPWGFVIASLAGIQGTLYLLVLATNAALFLGRGLVEPPGELPVWGMLTLATGAATVVLLASAGPSSEALH